MKTIMALMVVALFIISGCTHSPVTTYSYSPPTSADGRACVDECDQSKATCKNMCNIADPQCVANAQQKARVNYQNYVNQQTAAGQPVSQTLVSFYNPDQCAHSGCGCESEYKVCYQLCGTRTVIHDDLATQ